MLDEARQAGDDDVTFIPAYAGSNEFPHQD